MSFHSVWMVFNPQHVGPSFYFSQIKERVSSQLIQQLPSVKVDGSGGFFSLHDTISGGIFMQWWTVLTDNNFPWGSGLLITTD